MKKTLFLLAALFCLQVCNAASYDYLILENTDGTSTTLNVQGLSITFANGNLIANDGTTIVLSGLARMYFSETSGIATQQVTLPEGRVEVYTIAGNHVATFENAADVRRQLTKGIYVIRPAKGSTTKIVIR